jgi:hypothetical protein
VSRRVTSEPDDFNRGYVSIPLYVYTYIVDIRGKSK